MNVFFVTRGGTDLPSARCRAFQYVEPLAREGIRARVLVGRHLGAWGRWRLLAAAAHADCVVVQKKLLTRPFFSLLRSVSRTLLFDFDDALYATEPFVRAPRALGNGSRRTVARLRWSLRGAHGVLAGNAPLAEYAREVARRVEVVPTPIDLAPYGPVRPRGRDGGVRIGWIGLTSNMTYLIGIKKALEATLERFPQARLRVISGGEFVLSPKHAGRVETVPWSLESEAQALAGCDIGVMPLLEDRWSEGKCAYKLLQYMAAGCAVVASPVGANLEVVEEGRSGFIARSDAEWTTRLAQLVEDAALRSGFGEAGRRIVEERYSLDVWAPRLAGILRRWCER